MSGAALAGAARPGAAPAAASRSEGWRPAKRRRIEDLSDREILALAAANEAAAASAYRSFAERLGESHPDSGRLFGEMAAEEDAHRERLLALFGKKFQGDVPKIAPRDIIGIVRDRHAWTLQAAGADGMRSQARKMEEAASRFYHQAASLTSDADIRALFAELAAAEAAHEHTAGEIDADAPPSAARSAETESERRRFILQIVQPGLVGLMDGSVSTLAPVFAAAFATHSSHNAFLVGLAASLGAGISMGFAEALADDGKLSGRGTPLLRGLACGLMTFAGGIGHTLPYLIPSFWTATVLAGVVVVIELATIAWVQWRYMDTPPISAGAKVMLGGALVLAAGILIGSS
jgi:rubrerythrin